MIIASAVTMVDIVPVTASPPVEKMAPRRGVSRVVPQVGQPAPKAMSPVMMPAFSRLAALVELADCSRFLFHNNTISPMRVPWSMQIANVGNQSRNG